MGLAGGVGGYTKWCYRIFTSAITATWTHLQQKGETLVHPSVFKHSMQWGDLTQGDQPPPSRLAHSSTQYIKIQQKAWPILLMLIIMVTVRSLVHPKQSMELQGFHLTAALANQNKIEVVCWEMSFSAQGPLVIIIQPCFWQYKTEHIELRYDLVFINLSVSIFYWELRGSSGSVCEIKQHKNYYQKFYFPYQNIKHKY